MAITIYKYERTADDLAFENELSVKIGGSVVRIEVGNARVKTIEIDDTLKDALDDEMRERGFTFIEIVAAHVVPNRHHGSYATVDLPTTGVTNGDSAYDTTLNAPVVFKNSDWVDVAGTSTSVFAQLSSNVNQEPSVTTPVVITLNTEDEISGITHSTTVNPENITIAKAGTYTVTAQPQVGRTSGGTTQIFDMFVQVDTGTGFDDVPNSNIKQSILDSNQTDVIVSSFTTQLAVGNIIRFMQRISATGVGIGLKFTAAEVGPPTVPATPAIILNIFRIGD